MKINRIEFENFRNFKDKCRMDFPTDGSISVIYGPNGVGKTTLHQLFQWIFYGEVHFNKTASNRMYNLQYENSLKYGVHFFVKGAIDFEQPNANNVIEYYRIQREWEYVKDLKESKKIGETVDLIKKVGDDWKKVPGDPADFVEEHLPSGLSQYFFFDGESMIADLNLKGRDSAKSIRRALYSILDLDIYELAMSHIGKKESTSTVLGRLNLDKSKNSENKDIMIARANLKKTEKSVEELSEEIEKYDEDIDTCKKRLNELSEIIGSTPSRKDQENERNDFKNTISTIETSITNEVKFFGKDIISQYPYLLISRIVEEAGLRIGLKVESEDELISGLNKQLILALQKEEYCICGNHIGEKERSSLNELLKKFPPLSYKYIYDQFKKDVARWKTTYNPNILEEHLQQVFAYRNEIDNLQKKIRSIDDDLKNGTNVDEFIRERQDVEDSLTKLENSKYSASQSLGVQKKYLSQRSTAYGRLVDANKENKLINTQMEIMEEVYNYFESKLQTTSEMYSKNLGTAIQELLNDMLTSVRTVEMTPQFELVVKDSFGDEAKSEGQFAVVSFAYIGGIFKLLSEMPELNGKEFPLILDGPFSKLDSIQRQNVINTIPSYAPQIILFSKDDLSSCFDPDDYIYTWTIYSNAERNVSYVKDGYDPEVFKQDEA